MGQYGESRQRILRIVNEYRLYVRVTRSKVCFPGFAHMERLQVSNVPVREPISIGVQVPSKLSDKVRMWNVETSSVHPVQHRVGITARRAVGLMRLRG